jgi:hypothetical protein
MAILKELQIKLTLRKAEEATLPAAIRKSIISIVAPGKPSEKN